MEVYAHRGSSVSWPENTLAAFEAAIRDGADAIETDLRLTRDGTIALLHDEDLRRVAGDGRRVADLLAGELASVRTCGGHSIVRLEELLELAAGRVRLNLEIKARGVGAALARDLDSRDRGIVVTSAEAAELQALRAHRPDIPIGPVLERFGPAEQERARPLGWSVVSLCVEGFDRRCLSFCRDHGLQLLLWVVNAPERVIDFAQLGVTGVFSDCPSTVVGILRRLPSLRGPIVTGTDANCF